ncbi:MAG TPA: prepilin-type N-terminal cleavage/methylation domain-containing protein [Myxococcales bacterium]|nr:prepilin-type N-terminal cleavage/methylation domain-containing protein [Myxococcales bacterium]
MTRARRPAAGFTLLEVMIALAILAVALVAISNRNGGAVAMHAYSRRATEATLLLRGKMLDVEDDLQKNGFSDFSDEKHGDFSQESAPGYAWSAEILKPDVELDPAQLLTLLGATGKSGQPSNVADAAQALAGTLTGAPGAAQSLKGGGGAAMLAGPMGGMFMNEAKTFIETLKKSVREIRLTVSWQDGKERRDVTASQIVVILPESVGKTPGAPPPPATAAAPGTPAATPGLNQPTPIPSRGAQQ